jgi:predicted amidophosphoribosyltransferase
MGKWKPQICPNCKKEVKPEIVKCEKCGKPHKQFPAFCPHCGQYLQAQVYEFI